MDSRIRGNDENVQGATRRHSRECGNTRNTNELREVTRKARRPRDSLQDAVRTAPVRPPSTTRAAPVM